MNKILPHNDTNFTPLNDSSDLPSLSTTLAILGKGSIAAVFYGWYLISSEVVPTLQRSAAMSICSATARIGSFSAPYLMYTRKYNYLAPNMTMGALALSCGFAAVFFVPETLGMNVPDTVQEARENNRFYKWNIFKKFETCKPEQSSTPDDEEKELII